MARLIYRSHRMTRERHVCRAISILIKTQVGKLVIQFKALEHVSIRLTNLSHKKLKFRFRNALLFPYKEQLFGKSGGNTGRK